LRWRRDLAGRRLPRANRTACNHRQFGRWRIDQQGIDLSALVLAGQVQTHDQNRLAQRLLAAQ
jgi:hypothetical protein